MDGRQLVVTEYDPRWAGQFDELRRRIAPRLGGLARLRDHLRRNPDDVRRYSELKTALARRFHAHDEARLRYAEAKSTLVEQLIAAASRPA
ncbi:GrpB family protein [Streptomyces sp. NPDC086554]|uniref:GrpB family protein n=1 Tax=Streptomyces sp. NPDC086554 TaxID=3154864 RepID=UPI003448412E